MGHINCAKDVIKANIAALSMLLEQIPPSFDRLIEHILHMDGRVITSGIGKSGHIAKKISASLSSTGTPSYYIHATDASHGDLGAITSRDVVLMLSNSGETAELFDMINYCKINHIPIASITMNPDSILAKSSDLPLILPKTPEASDVGAPTVSALMALAMGDALVVALHKGRNFTKKDFLLFHPGGKIGKDKSA